MYSYFLDHLHNVYCHTPYHFITTSTDIDPVIGWVETALGTVASSYELKTWITSQRCAKNGKDYLHSRLASCSVNVPIKVESSELIYCGVQYNIHES